MHDTRDFLTKRLEAVKNARNAGDFEELALIIGTSSLYFPSFPWNLELMLRTQDGKSLSFALEKELSGAFLELAVMCKAVVCCASLPLSRRIIPVN